jgi:hypothetical protein
LLSRTPSTEVVRIAFPVAARESDGSRTDGGCGPRRSLDEVGRFSAPAPIDTAPPVAQLCAKRSKAESRRSQKAPSAGGHAWGWIRTGKGGFGCPLKLTMPSHQVSRCDGQHTFMPCVRPYGKGEVARSRGWNDPVEPFQGSGPHREACTPRQLHSWERCHCGRRHGGCWSWKRPKRQASNGY